MASRFLAASLLLVPMIACTSSSNDPVPIALAPGSGQMMLDAGPSSAPSSSSSSGSGSSSGSLHPTSSGSGETSGSVVANNSSPPDATVSVEDASADDGGDLGDGGDGSSAPLDGGSDGGANMCKTKLCVDPVFDCPLQGCFNGCINFFCN